MYFLKLNFLYAVWLHPRVPLAFSSVKHLQHHDRHSVLGQRRCHNFQKRPSGSTMMRSNSQKSLHAADEEWGTPRAQETEAQEQPTNAAQKSNGTKRCFIVDSRWIFVAMTVILLAIIAILGGVLVSKNKNERNSSESSVTERANEGSTPAVVPSPSPTLSMSIRPTPSPTHTPSASPVSMIPNRLSFHLQALMA